MIPYYDTHTHTHTTTSDSDIVSIFNLRLAEAASTVPTGLFSVGIHPYDAHMATKRWLDELETLAQHPFCVAIGESGIDNLSIAIDEQKRVFKRHIQLANRLHKPLIIHCVKAQSEVFTILAKMSCTVPIILHSYAKYNAQTAISGALFSVSKANLAAARSIPIEKILFETDDNQLPISDIYAQAARIFDIPLDRLKQQIKTTFTKTFPR